MSDPLERKSLATRLADILEGEIRAGDWPDRLPGHRTLMERYSVSAKTCLAAIDFLESRGLISSGEQGRKRRILVEPDKPENDLKDLLIVDGTGSQSGEDFQQIHAYRKAWEENGGKVHNIKFDFPRYRRPEALLREAAASYKADAILLHVPPLVWTKAAIKLRPTFISGGEWSGQQITGVAYELQKVLSSWVTRLKELGHTRIMVPTDFVGPLLEIAVRGGVAEGLGLDENSPELANLCPVFSERIPEAWQHYWKRAFAKVRPTAIILTDDIHYLSLCGYCYLNGIRIPKDLSVVCLESSEHLEWCEPVPTRMRFPVEAAAKYFRKWIRSGCLPMGMKYFALECIEAQTVASAPRR